MVQPAENYNDIAQSAFLTAYWRQFGATPYATELYRYAADAWQAEGRPLPELDPDHTFHGPTMEIRQLAGNVLLGQIGNSQIIDIAAGFSPRGLQQTEAHDAMRYVEVDLPIVQQTKRKAVQRIGATALGSRYFLVGGNALDPQTIEQAQTHLDYNKPVSIFNEGLLHYLDNNERAQFVRNVVNVLHQLGGYLVTDLPHQPNAEQARAAPSFTPAGTKRDVAALAFTDQATAIEFFADHGLIEESRLSYTDKTLLAQLQSPGRLGISIDDVAQKQRPWGMYVFRVAT